MTKITSIQDGGAVTIELDGMTYTGPAFVARNLTAKLMDASTDFDDEMRQVAFLTVAALARAAWIGKAQSLQQRADREFALGAIEGGEGLLHGLTWEQLLSCFGCTPDRFALVVARWSKEAVAERRAEEMARRRAEIQADWDFAKTLATREA